MEPGSGVVAAEFVESGVGDLDSERVGEGSHNSWQSAGAVPAFVLSGRGVSGPASGVRTDGVWRRASRKDQERRRGVAGEREGLGFVGIVAGLACGCVMRSLPRGGEQAFVTLSCVTFS